MQVGTKELKNRLSHYLRMVRAGELLLVTDRGEVVAEIRAAPQKPRKDEVALAEMEQQGLITRGSGRARDIVPIETRGKKLVSALCIEDRG